MSFVGRLFGGPDTEPQPLRLDLRTDNSRTLLVGRSGYAGGFGWHGLSDEDRFDDARAGETNLNLGGTDNQVLHRVIVLAGHRCNRLTRVWGGGELVRSSPLPAWSNHRDSGVPRRTTRASLAGPTMTVGPSKLLIRSYAVLAFCRLTGGQVIGCVDVHM